MHFLVDERGAKYSSCFPLLCPSMQYGFLFPVLRYLGASLAQLFCYRKGTVCYPRVCFFLHASDQGDKSRGHGNHFSRNRSVMSSDPESPPLPCCAGQPEAGCAPLALPFPFACVGSPLLYILGSRCAHWTPASWQVHKVR